MSRESGSFNRRHFLKSAGAIAAASALPAWFIEEQRSYAAPAKKLSANDKPNIALIGCGGQGRGDAKRAQQFGDVVAVCDVDESHAQLAAEQFEGAKAYSDFRKVMERDDIHVIITGTPDHWHTLVNLAAIKAGKDVYSEKPLTLTIDEGKRLVKAVRENNRILQTGSQQRSEARFRLACELVRNGRIGKLTRIWVGLPAGLREGPFKPQPAPAGLNWDFWLGQAPKVEYVPQRCHFSFRYWWDYSGGTMTDWGAHHNDIALWAMGLDRSGPVTIEGKPLVEMIPGGYTAASEYRVEYTYANGVKHICESLTTDSPTGTPLKEPEPGKFRIGIKFEGTEGWIYVTRGDIKASKRELLEEPLPADAVRLYVSNNHMGNFFDCVQSRKPPICDVEIGHRSVSVCHLGVIAIRLGRKLTWDPVKEEFVGDKEANSYVAREMRKPYTYEMISTAKEGKQANMDDRLKALLEQKWSEIKPRSDPASVRPGVVWSYRVSPPFPSEWPLAPASTLISYAFAEGHDLGGGLMDAVHVSAPWARIEEPAQPGSPPKLEMVAAKVVSVGIQGVRPLSREKVDAGSGVELTAGALLELARAQGRDSENKSALRTQYRGWCDGNGVFTGQIRDRHKAFFNWVYG